MDWYPSRISTRLTLGGIVLLIVTTLVIVVIMLWRGQPRVVEINTALIEETGHGLTRQLSTVLSRVEGETVSLARLAEVLPNDENLYRTVAPQLLGIDSDSIITGGGIWPEPNAFTPGPSDAVFSGRVIPIISWCIRMNITLLPVMVTITKAGINRRKDGLRKTACGLTFIRTPFPELTW